MMRGVEELGVEGGRWGIYNILKIEQKPGCFFRPYKICSVPLHRLSPEAMASPSAVLLFVLLLHNLPACLASTPTENCPPSPEGQQASDQNQPPQNCPSNTCPTCPSPDPANTARLAYLITAHDERTLLDAERLVNEISHPNNVVMIHVDRSEFRFCCCKNGFVKVALRPKVGRRVKGREWSKIEEGLIRRAAQLFTAVCLLLLLLNDFSIFFSLFCCSLFSPLFFFSSVFSLPNAAPSQSTPKYSGRRPPSSAP